MPFTFTLARMLGYRRAREKERQATLAAALARRNRAEAYLAALQGELAERCRPWQGTRAVRELQIDQFYLEGLATRAEQAAQELVRVEQEVEARRLQYLDARLERRTMEQLEVKQAREYQVEEERRERRVLDEMTTIAYARRPRS